MNYLSVCSGIEAVTVAWEGLGWKPVGFSEIEPFPSAVLEHHYPSTPNFGDMTQFKTWDINDSNISLLVGGTPCQSFSVAGLRKGLHDPRGGLMLTYLEIAQHFRPKWIVWENVPGVLSSAGGRDFGSFLGALGELGYGWAYRVLDAQWFGVAQRRRRVFVVGCLGDPTAAAKVLFESESVCRDLEKSRKARKGVAPTVTSGAPFSRTGNDRVECDALIPMLSKCLTRGTMQRYDTETETLIPQPIAFHSNAQAAQLPTASRDTSVSDPLTASQSAAIAFTVQFCDANGTRKDRKNGGLYVTDANVSPALTRADSPVRICEGFTQCDAARDVGMGVSPTLRSGGAEGYPNHSVSYGWLPSQGSAAGSVGYEKEIAPTLRSGCDKYGLHQPPMQVRRLTPTECERLQGFPDRYTAIPWKGKSVDDCPDGPRYKALGNSMAVPVMRWIGERIHALEKPLDLFEPLTD